MKFHKDIDFNRVNILEVAHKLGMQLHPIQSGRQYTTKCWNCETTAFGEDKNPKGHLTIRPDKNVFRCPRCGYSGGAWGLANDLLGKEKALNIIKSCGPYNGPEIVDNPVSPIEDRHAVYSAFLDQLVLSPTHREALIQRGLHKDHLETNGYKTTLGWHSSEGICRRLIQNGYNLNGIPGFHKDKNGKWTLMTLPGFLIPVRDMVGRIQGLQIRVDDPYLAKRTNLRKYIWLSSVTKPDGCSSGAPIHVSLSHTTINENCEVWLTEGPLKADVASLYLGIPFLGIPGVSLYRQASASAARMGIENLIVAYDSDYLENPHVLKSEVELMRELQRKGINALPVKWHGVFGKGIDDVCVRAANGKYPVDRSVIRQIIQINKDLQMELEISIKFRRTA